MARGAARSGGFSGGTVTIAVPAPGQRHRAGDAGGTISTVPVCDSLPVGPRPHGLSNVLPPPGDLCVDMVIPGDVETDPPPNVVPVGLRFRFGGGVPCEPKVVRRVAGHVCREPALALLPPLPESLLLRP